MSIRKIPLIQGSYLSRWLGANAQRVVNLYADQNPEDAPFPFTFYPTPGLRTVWTPSDAAPSRGLYTASSGDLYSVVGKNVYYIAPNWNATLLGQLTTNVTPVSMKDNGFTLVIVDGTPSAFTIDLASRAFAPYSDPNFLGADRVDYLDGFLLFNQPNTRNFYTTLLNTTELDPTYIAAKSAAPDNLSRVVCIERLAWLMGVLNSEVWGNAGAPDFPFEEVPGAFIQHGLTAPYSVATHDNAIFFVEQNKDGKGVVARAAGYAVQRISTPAIEAELGTYPTLADATGFCYSLLGHVHYVINFPSADKTWDVDVSHEVPMWNQWAWADSDGILHRHRAACGAFAYGTNVVGDWQSGVLYELDPYTYTDAGAPIIHIRGFPHMVSGGRLAEFQQFQAEMQVGQLQAEASVSLRLSPNRGASWSQPMVQGLGALGDFLRVPQWRQLGLSRDLVFELEWSFDAPAALNGAYALIGELDS